MESSSFSPRALRCALKRRAQEIGVVDAGNFDRILERQEHARCRALFGIERQQIDAVIDHRPAVTS
jgi:hypothetical protein